MAVGTALAMTSGASHIESSVGKKMEFVDIWLSYVLQQMGFIPDLQGLLHSAINQTFYLPTATKLNVLKSWNWISKFVVAFNLI